MNKTISEEINIMRGIATLGVIAGHAFSNTKLYPINGAFWVWIFFIISGYLQGYSFFTERYSLDIRGIKRFWINRGLRILPLFWLILILSCMFHYFFKREVFHSFDFLRQFFVLTSNYYLVGPLWSISTEIHFYFLVPFICLLIKKTPESYVVLICLVMTYYLYVFFF